MASGDIFKLVLEGLGPQGQQLTNTLYYEQELNIGDPQGTQLIDGWYAAASAEFIAMLSATCSFTQMHTRNLSQPLYGLDYTLSPSLAGDITGECLPPAVAGVLQFTTGLIGKTMRGRNYTWPTGEGQQNQGQWTVGHQGLATAYGNALQSVSNGGETYHHVILVGVDPGTPPVGQLVIEVSLDPITRLQRRRTPGVGS